MGLCKAWTSVQKHTVNGWSLLTPFQGLPIQGKRKLRNRQYTMLQKLSKCEVEAWLCWNLIILLPLRFYVKSNFGKFKQSKNVIFGNFRDFELWILVNLGLERCTNLLKSKFRVSKIVKNDIFGPFELAKIGFHVKSEWR